MEEPERIAGKKIYQIIKELQENHTIIKLNILGTGYERLTMVTDIRDIDGIPHFFIDYPKGIGEVIGNKEREARFEFKGRDHIIYFFRSKIRHGRRKELPIPFPEEIFRIQRRRYFRLEAPVGTKMRFRFENLEAVAIVINISLKGALLFQKKRDISFKLAPGDILKDLLMDISDGGRPYTIKIDDANVRWTDTDPERGGMLYGIEFVYMDPKVNKVLKEIIYRIQRRYLQLRTSKGI